MVGRLLFGGWGRKAAWAVLLLFVVLQVAAPALFSLPRFGLFDFYQRTMPRLEHGNPVVIVAIDEASLKSVGQWPWPRHVTAELVTKVLSGAPLALGIDTVMAEPDRSSPDEWLRHAGDMPAAVREAVRALPSHEAALAQAIAAGPVMLGIGGVDDGPADAGPLTPYRQVGSGNTSPPAALPRFAGALRSLPVLDQAARGHGLLSVTPDDDGVFRRLPLVVRIGERAAPSMVVELLRLTAKATTFEVYAEHEAVKGVGVGPLSIPSGADGSVWVHYSPHDPRRFVSAADVLAGRVGGEAFRDKIVIVGVTGLGITDLRPTPVGYMPGPEVNAQLIENILDARLVERPTWTRLAEPIATLLLGLLLIAGWRLAGFGWQALMLVTAIAVLGAIGVAFWQSLMLVDVATPALGVAAAFFAFVAAHSAETARHLQQARVAKARAEGEMEAGRRIQMGMLPGAASVAGDTRFDLGALMVPARQIGGDLYDFFKIDERRLFFAVGDVSGKGVPAALFMALGKSLCKSYALRGETDVAGILTLANGEIARDNPEMLFITMFAGLLDLDTGELQFCNAGQDTPYLLRNGVAEAVVSSGGPPLCVVEDFPYATERLRLKPGDLLCVMTDGVSEAMDGNGALLGAERTKQILSAMPADWSANGVVDELYKAVGRFVGGAEASDDLTVLAIRWNGVSAP